MSAARSSRTGLAALAFAVAGLALALEGAATPVASPWVRWGSTALALLLAAGAGALTASCFLGRSPEGLRAGAQADQEARERILEAAAFCSTAFLESRVWSDRAAEALARLGQAAAGESAYLFENREAVPGEALISDLRLEWAAPGARRLSDNPDLRELEWPASGPVRDTLARGDVAAFVLDELNERGRALLNPLGITSILIVPIFVDGFWWGFLGFAEFRRGRLWSTAETEALRTAAAAIAAAIGRERAEGALRESEERFRSLIEGAPVAVSISRGERRLYANRKYREMFRVPSEEDVGSLPVSGGVAPEDRARIVEWTRRRGLGEAVPSDYEVMGQRRDGSRFPMHVAVAVVTLADGPASVAFLTDVTEQRASEEALRASEKKYRDIFRYSPAGIYQARLDGTLITANETFGRLLGYEDPEEILGLNLARDVYEDPDERARLIERYDATGYGANVEVALRRRDGTRFWSEMSAHAVKDAEGRTAYFEGFVQDVTGRKAAEAELRESEERYRLLFEGNPLSMVVYDPDTLALLAVNEAMVRQSGFTRGELLGLGLADIALPDDPQIARVRALAGEPRPDVVHVGLSRQRRKDGGLVEVDVTSLAIRYAGRPARLALLRDVTTEREAEAEKGRLRQALESEAAEWQRTVDAVDTAIMILDSTLRSTRMNRAARDLSGRDRPTRPEPLLLELSGREPWRTGLALAERARATGTEASGQARDPVGGRSWEATAYLAPAGPGLEPRIILTIRDTTRLVALQETLRRSETLAALGSLVAGVAHEVRNPLFSITATLDTVESSLAREGGHAEYVGALRSAVARLDQLTRDLLDYGRPPQLRKTRVRPDELVRRSLRSCARLARERGVEPLHEVPPDLPEVEVDAGRMEQVFQNLVANAIQHSERGGRVRVSGRLASDGEGDVELLVEDDGPGLAAGDLPHLFEPFFSRRRGGTGLGLSIVDRIVESHGGRISASNRLHKGAVFTVTLPASWGPAKRP